MRPLDTSATATVAATLKIQILITIPQSYVAKKSCLDVEEGVGILNVYLSRAETNTALQAVHADLSV